ncbi:LysR family transcriptional regulator [Pseudoalteromonas sp. SG43-7]|uniref:LysR family transcriptional regulator n=1 Tax=Pseudoalteromonas sp. SG43-7 TaxID=2760966 RepID=UPI00160082D7|nr:LysR family transcriptional regulator [Pseudoalteromonas sp. SG43-7]MBB1424131.1 LysR family transcriptional regulator [Pseudoalteromonas sp. SG43-7]
MNKKNLSLDRMRTFVRVAESGKFSKAAKELGIAQPSVTRHIAELEEELHSPLITRTTRSLTLTSEGKMFYDKCVDILNLVENLTQTVGKNSSTEGKIKVSCTVSLGVLYFCKIINKFQSMNPNTNIELSLTDERIDLVKDDVDIAIRLGPLSDSSLKLKVLGYSERLFVSSPSYLNDLGYSPKINDLAKLDCVLMKNIINSEKLSVTNRGNDEVIYIKLSGNLKVDNGLAVKELVADGRGIAPVHNWLVNDYLLSNSLLEIVKDYSLPAVQLSLLYVPQKAELLRVRALIDFISEECLKIPGISK